MSKKLFFFTLVILTSCEAIFVEDISNEIVTILAPLNNTETSEGIVFFNWEEVSDSADYQVQIAKPDFTNTSQILLDSVISSNSISKRLEKGEYQWRIKSLNSEYSTTYTTASFSVK